MVRRGGIVGGCGDAQAGGERWWGVRFVGGDGRGIREPDSDGMAGLEEGPVIVSGVGDWQVALVKSSAGHIVGRQLKDHWHQ